MDEINERAELVQSIIVALNNVHEQFFTITFTEDWKNWELADQLLFRNAVKILFGISAVHKEKFDSDVWKGHANGTVNIAIESIRQERTGDKPGRKAEAITPESILAKRLK